MQYPGILYAYNNPGIRMDYIKKLKELLDIETKRKLMWLVAFSIFVSIVETIGITAIMPFIDIATNFDNIHSNQYYQWVFNFFDFNNSENGNVNFSIAFGLTLIGFYLFRGGVNLSYGYYMTRFTESIYAKTTKRLFTTYLSMPYLLFSGKNSSYLTKTIVTEASLMAYVVTAVLLMISEIFVIIFLYTMMLIVSLKITLIFTIILAIKISLLTKAISKRVKLIGLERAQIQEKYYEIINRLFGNFKQMKLKDIDRINADNNAFQMAVNRYTQLNAINAFLTIIPRLFLETIGFGLVIFLLIILLYLGQGDVAHFLPTLSLFVLAMYRLLPSVNRIVSSYNTVLWHHKSIDIITEELKTPKEDLLDKNIEFRDKIELKNINFSYQERLVISDISLTINKGEKIGFVGESGTGKSTLIDLIIGIYQPNQGEITIDGMPLNNANLQNWRSQIGYIPQQVYLFDGTIAENVCFGKMLDKSLLEKVLKQANIFDFLQTKQGINTLVGEGGIQLSGGQKQRIAIARAFYTEPEILVLDEATSALDEETEKRIMDEIYHASQNKTLIIIAHRLSTIRLCSKVYELKNNSTLVSVR
jgi:ATP-binding cassette, subfamily B, bacterial PglK